ncbi:hypothetical protein TWF225_008903 [Orbilia oligospora]|uniref:Uncharacterized protein n=1 Tax=Orbilia oligospora TaxID=2813651 RepID=A0A7C8PG33_ORBOL|nr:hypothetical protein TWF751_001777 [Orbilia oligospora]KAF3175805.1 hypothetical protein TWF225_008903 [Orbilia oligospora]KAF3243142.1 hypothetical protein TWF128_010351 [Orbilia oligospora]TGJ65397.1 hypothetical protein EYR41_009370 [Orbilia oligospora]
MQLSEFLEAIAAPQLITCWHLSTTKTNKPVHPREHLPDLAEWTGIKRISKSFSIQSLVSRERGKGKLVLEWEAPWALATPDNLIEEFNSEHLSNGRPTKLVKAVSQLYGYMTFNKMRIRALCDYESLYLFQRVGSSGFRVSPLFKFSDRGTESPVAALVSICHQAVTVGSFHHSPIEQGPPGTHMLKVEDFVVRGTWKEKGNTEILWEQIRLYLARRVTRNRRSCLEFTKIILKSRRKLLTKT